MTTLAVPAPAWAGSLTSGLVLALAALLLFAQLGHYALWADESKIGLLGKGVLRTGDTSVQPDDHNLVAYRGGILVRALRDRSTPPLSAYLAAGSMWLLGETALAARLPFALFGLATVGLLVWWMNRARPDLLTRILFGIAILGNVSFFLYCRQCCYYAPTVFFTIAVAFLYLHWNGDRKRLLAMAACSVLLFASNYFNCLALYCCLALDYVVWGRKIRPLKPADWAALLAPQAALSGLLALVWNPLRTEFGGYVLQNALSDRFQLLFWNIRDLNACEFGCGALLLAAAGLAILRKDRWLQRGLAALAVYILFVTFTSPQTVSETSVADVRYLMPLIPLCMALGALAIRRLAGSNTPVALSIGLAAFASNLLNGGPMIPGGFRSTIAEYARELASPPPEPYSATAEWIRRNVKPGETVWVLPDYMAHPLMFHAPAPLYAWQLAANNHDPQFAGLPPALFQGRVPPDYIVLFGPVAPQVRQMVASWPNVSYRDAATIDCFWQDLYRPELFWRTFKPVTGYNKDSEAIYVLKRGD